MFELVVGVVVLVAVAVGGYLVIKSLISHNKKDVAEVESVVSNVSTVVSSVSNSSVF